LIDNLSDYKLLKEYHVQWSVKYGVTYLGDVEDSYFVLWKLVVMISTKYFHSYVI
jgi:hypothetical protein